MMIVLQQVTEGQLIKKSTSQEQAVALELRTVNDYW
jgi:hypothetical protein